MNGLDSMSLLLRRVRAVLASARAASGHWGRAMIGAFALVPTAPLAADAPLPTADQVGAAVRHHIESERLARGVGWVLIREGEVEMGLEGPLVAGGDPAQMRFEIGSISKTLTAWLAAEAVTEGGLAWSATLGELAPADVALPDAPSAVTLSELAAHRSGLPRLSPRGADIWRGLVGAPFDPYAGSTAAEVWQALAAVRTLPEDRQSLARYSNLGYAVLGQAVARGLGQDYAQALRERILGPHGLAGMRLSTSGEVIAGLIEGTGENGLRARPWHLDGYGPAGGLVASVEDMARYARVLLDPPPALAGLLAAPAGLAEAEGSLTGTGFLHRRFGQHHLRWHNGGTGGFRSFVGVIPEQRFALVLLGSTPHSLDPLAWHLLDPSRPAPAREWRWLPLLMMALGMLIAPLAMFAIARQGLPPRPGKQAPDRIELLVLVAQLLFLVGLARALGDFAWLGILPWWLALALTTIAAAIALARHWRGLPANTRSMARNMGRLAGLVLTVLLALMFLRG